jgi:putative membrane protein insertion efficiency factor
VQRLLIGLVRLYQLLVSPLLPKTCRFLPSCSQYMIEAIQHYGVLTGLARGCWRVIRCNPFCPGGYDPVVGAHPSGHDTADAEHSRQPQQLCGEARG